MASLPGRWRRTHPPAPPSSMTTSPSRPGSERASVPPSRIRQSFLRQPREMVLGRPPQQRHSGQPDQGPASGSRTNLAKDREGGGRSPDVEERVVIGKTRGVKALCLGEDGYSQLVGPPGPKAEMNEHASQGRPRPGREQRVPLRVASFRGEADPHRNARAPERGGKPESEFRLQNESNPTGQLEAVVSRSQDRSGRGPWSPYSHPLVSAGHGCHLTRPWISWLGGHRSGGWWCWHDCGARRRFRARRWRGRARAGPGLFAGRPEALYPSSRASRLGAAPSSRLTKSVAVRLGSCAGPCPAAHGRPTEREAELSAHPHRGFRPPGPFVRTRTGFSGRAPQHPRCGSGAKGTAAPLGISSG